MAFKKVSQVVAAHGDPEALFRDLRSRRVQGLMSQQADTLRSYMAAHEEPDIALELPTGSGKTLVGLLIAEWRRIKFRERCIILCPTNQLVYQVVEHAREKYGIDVVGFTGSKKAYNPSDLARYTAGKVVAVTNYSTLFNSHPAFEDNGTLIFDDAHAAENYVSKCWSIEIYRREKEHSALFQGIVSIIDPHITDQDRLSFSSEEETPIDNQWVNKLPTAAFHNVRGQLMAQLDLADGISEIYHPWSMLRDNFHACSLYYTSNAILIRPLMPPTESFGPFRRAKQRIYMSATLGEGGDLERIFGSYRIKRIPAPTGWEKQGVGRRFMLFPMCTMTEEQAKKFAVRWIANFKRALILTPSDRAAEEYRELVQKLPGTKEYSLFTAEEIEKSKADFVLSKGVAVLANRYDGIDMLEEECRCLIVSGLPEATNLQERFLMSRIGAGVMFNVRVRTRVTQALGRCTRSAIDWALVVVVGDKISSYFLKEENRECLHPELQAEIEFGLAQSAISTEEIEENIRHFSEQDDEWIGASEEILQIREHKTKVEHTYTKALAQCVKHEVEYSNSIWSGHYTRALSAAADALNELSGDELRGYRAWWCYLAGSAAFLSSQDGEAGNMTVAADWYSKAAAAAPSVPWLRKLGNTLAPSDKPAPSTEGDFSEVIERLEKVLESFGKSNSKKMEAKFSSIRSGLGQTKDAKAFEAAQVALGTLLGYISLKPLGDSAPDPYWILSPTEGIVFEDYSAPEGENPRIGKGKILQAKGHLEWLATNHPTIEFKVIFCAATDKVTQDSAPFQGGVYFFSVTEMARFADEAMILVRKLWDSFSKSGDLAWREAAARKLSESKFTPSDVAARLSQRPLSSLAASV